MIEILKDPKILFTIIIGILIGYFGFDSSELSFNFQKLFERKNLEFLVKQSAYALAFSAIFFYFIAGIDWLRSQVIWFIQIIFWKLRWRVKFMFFRTSRENFENEIKEKYDYEIRKKYETEIEKLEHRIEELENGNYDEKDQDLSDE